MKILNFDFGATPRYTMRSSMTLKRGYEGKLDMVNRIQQEFSKSDNSTSSNQFCSFILFHKNNEFCKPLTLPTQQHRGQGYVHFKRVDDITGSNFAYFSSCSRIGEK